jgi:hypothetical protein
MTRVTLVKPLPGFRLAVEFSDGLRGEVSMENRLFGPVFEPLREWDFFSKVFIDEFGVICWPNGADLAPDALHDRLAAQNTAA